MDDLVKSFVDRHVHTAIQLYEGAWRLAGPVLRVNRRLREGLPQRRLDVPLPGADLWIQAASGGEAYLALTLIEQLRPVDPVRVLVTTNTRQGMDILEKAVSERNGEEIAVSTAYFPFDRPALMRKALRQAAPGMVVLLETEIWPGLLYAGKMSGRPVMTVNGRMTEKSLARYRKLAKTLRPIGPERILAISDDDARRFSEIFGAAGVSVMPNIKFDRIAAPLSGASGRIAHLIPVGTPFLVLGSVRQEEEGDAAAMLHEVAAACPGIVIGVFPRHMHRVTAWKERLGRLGLKWRLRSALDAPGRLDEVIIWDVFGELAGAYAAASAVFVGGSLAPLGGQNFLEPLMCGVIPVIGPSYENFAWVGDHLFDRGLVVKTANHRQAARRLIAHLQAPPDRSRIQAEALAYIRSRQGGTRQACGIIRRELARQRLP